MHEILRSGYAGRRHGRRQIARGSRRIMPFGTENTVNPTVLMGRKAHVVKVRFIPVGRGNRQRTVAEPESIDPVVALSQSEKGFTVVPFDPDHQYVFAVELDGSGIERSVDPEPFEQKRVSSGVQVVAPEERRMRSREDRVSITGPYSVGIRCRIFPADQLLMNRTQG